LRCQVGITGAEVEGTTELATSVDFTPGDDEFTDGNARPWLALLEHAASETANAHSAIVRELNFQSDSILTT
jgi:hypothetical protein